jgi:hypothetical protein
VREDVSLNAADIRCNAYGHLNVNVDVVQHVKTVMFTRAIISLSGNSNADCASIWAALSCFFSDNILTS